MQGFLYAFQDPRQMFKLLLNWLHFLGLDTLYHEGHHQLGLLGTQTFHSWLNIIHPEVINIDDYDVLLKTTPDPDEVLRPFILSIFNQAFVVFSEPFRTQIVLLWLRYEAQTKKATAKEIKVTNPIILYLVFFFCRKLQCNVWAKKVKFMESALFVYMYLKGKIFFFQIFFSRTDCTDLYGSNLTKIR